MLKKMSLADSNCQPGTCDYERMTHVRRESIRLLTHIKPDPIPIKVNRSFATVSTGASLEPPRLTKSCGSV